MTVVLTTLIGFAQSGIISVYGAGHWSAHRHHAANVRVYIGRVRATGQLPPSHPPRPDHGPCTIPHRRPRAHRPPAVCDRRGHSARDRLENRGGVEQDRPPRRLVREIDRRVHRPSWCGRGQTPEQPRLEHRASGRHRETRWCIHLPRFGLERAVRVRGLILLDYLRSFVLV
ncbi:hypothetical protein C8R46DRAFT_440159 [Mycena filopes]|nr:hypothetical protein C8R46DRAFT_440159 [Mycena filopes]